MTDFEKTVQEVLKKEDEFNNNYTKNCELAKHIKTIRKDKKNDLKIS